MTTSDDPQSLDQVVNTTDYPLTETDSAVWRDVVARTRRDLHTVGCSVLSDFIRPSSQEDLRQQGAQIAPLAYYDVETVNAYNIATDTELPADHPGRITMERGNAFVAWDNIPRDSIIHRLYTHPGFQRFVATCFELPKLHELGDPLAGLVLNVIPPGRSHPWHFDTNEFTVSMVTQLPEEGGEFEYCPNIRSAESENLSDVWAVLTGDDRLVRRLTLRPGDLQLFKGRYSLHRVSPVGGDRARHTVIFAYSEQPGVIGTLARTRQLFGRVLPEHVAADGRAVRVDKRLD